MRDSSSSRRRWRSCAAFARWRGRRAGRSRWPWTAASTRPPPAPRPPPGPASWWPPPRCLPAREASGRRSAACARRRARWPHRTGAVPDVLLVTSPVFLRHQTPPDHPERPARLTAVLDALRESALAESVRQTEDVAPVARDLLTAVHHPEYIDEVARVAHQGGGFLDPAPFVSPPSFDVALAAAGGAVYAVDEVLGGRASAAFALLRPPGHHALPDRGMGFCLFNNAAGAATAAPDRHGPGR